MSDELRSEQRVPARLPVEIVRRSGNERYETSDVSFRGLFVEGASVPLRALLRLRLLLPLGAIEVHAMVVYTSDDANGPRGRGVGLQFWGLGGAERERWNDWVRGLVVAERQKARRR